MKDLTTTNPHADIILFDGVCNFCCTSVQFIIQRDPSAQFTFASQQSEVGRALLDQAKLPLTMDTFVLITQTHAYTRSAAALRVASKLTQPWPLCAIFWLVPRFLRDAAYDLIARHRYRWFGQKEQCWVPSTDLRKRFLA